MKTAAAPFDPNTLVAEVAEALLKSASGDCTAQLKDLTPEDRADFQLAAHAAIAAHDRWLSASGFRIVPPGCLPAPENETEAKAMQSIGAKWLKAHPGRRLIIPAREALN